MVVKIFKVCHPPSKAIGLEISKSLGLTVLYRLYALLASGVHIN